MSNQNVDVAFLNKPGFAQTAISSQSSSTSSSTTQTSNQSPSQTVSTSSAHPLASLYPYTPLISIAGIFAALYFLLILHHFYLCIWKPLVAKSVNQKHTYTVPLLVASVICTVGYTLRVFSAATEGSRTEFGLYGISQACIIVSPIFICATLYLMISHLIQLCLPAGSEQEFFRVNPRWLGIIFMLSDVSCFLLQGSGSAMAAPSGWRSEKATLRKTLVLGGLAAQLVIFSMFLVVLTMFCIRVKRGHVVAHKLAQRNNDAANREFGFNPLAKEVVKGIWIASVLLEIRSAYRGAQFALSVDGYLFRHEWTLWVMDVVPVWLSLFVLGIFHPIKWLQGRRPSQFIQKKTIS